MSEDLSKPMFPTWVWTKRLARLDTDLTRDKTAAEILQMGFKRWDHEFRGGADQGTLVYARCLYERNERSLKRLPSERRKLILKTKTAVWLMANACIALQHTEDGGGTSQIHNPRRARRDVEELTWALMNEPPHVMLRKPPAQLLASIRRSLVFRTAAPSWRIETYGADPAPALADERRYARLALRHFDEAARLTRLFAPAKAKAIRYLLDMWSIGEHEPGLLGAVRWRGHEDTAAG